MKYVGGDDGSRGVVDQDGRAVLNRAKGELPIVHLIVAMKVLANLGAALARRTIDQIQPHLVGQHGAHRVKIAGIEAVDVACQQLALLRVQRRRPVDGDALGQARAAVCGRDAGRL